MSLFMVTGTSDERVVLSPQWIEEVVRPLTCPTCWVLHPHVRGTAIDMRLQSTHAVRGPFLNAGHRSPLLVVSTSIVHALAPCLGLFAQGRLLIADEPCASYITLNARQEAYLSLYDDARSPHSRIYPCDRCGRRCEMLVGQKYFDPACVRAGVVYSGCAGAAFTVDQSMLDVIRSVCKERLSIEEIRPGPPPNWGDRPWPPPMTDSRRAATQPPES